MVNTPGSYNRKIIASAALLMIVLFPLFLLMVFRSQATLDRLPIGESIPPLTIVDERGKVFDLHDLSGAKYALFFLSDDCPHCLRMLGSIEILDTLFRDRVRVICISLSGNKPATLPGRQLPLLFADRDEVIQKMKILAVPTMFFVNERGVLCGAETGERSLLRLRELFARFSGQVGGRLEGTDIPGGPLVLRGGCLFVVRTP